MTDDIKMMPIPAGSLFTISTGEYSNYSVHGVFRALREIDADQLRASWLLLHPDNDGDYTFDDRAFLGSLAREGLLEPVDAYEWHLCDYSRVSEMDVMKIDNSFTLCGHAQAPGRRMRN